MRYFVPTRIWRMTTYLGAFYPYELDGQRLPNLASYLAAGDDYVEVDDPNYFWCTEHQKFNNCVHSKLMASDGKSLGVPVQDTDGYTLLDYFKLAGGPFQQHNFRSIEWCSGVGTVSRSRGGWTYTLSLSRSKNLSQTELTLSFGIDLLRADKGMVARYGTKIYGTKTTRLALKFHGKKVDEVYRVGYRLECTSTEWVGDPLGIDKSLITSALVALYNNYAFEWTSGSYFVTDCTIHEKILDTAAAWVEKSLIWTARKRQDELHNVSLPGSRATDYINLPKASNNFVLHEREIIAEGIDSYLVTAGQDWSHYWWNVAIQQAYLDALQNVPRLNDNSISNIIEIAGFIKALVVDHRIEIPKSLSDVWLSYRYQYITGKLDAKEAIDFVHRHRSLGTLDKWISCYGLSHITYNDCDITCRCGLKIRPTDIATLQRIWRALYTYGLQPNFYVIWDMIPYSFIVDWLIPVGKLASVLDAESNYDETKYEIRDVIFSFSYDRLIDGMIFHQYSRFLSPGVVTLNGLYFFEEDPISTRVVGYRALDLLSLILGRR